MKNLKKVLALVVALTMVLGTVSFAFTDVDVENDAYTAVQTLSALNILNGYEDGTFGPEKDITRAEFAAVVCRALNMEGSANGSKGATPFTDVPADHWASGYINLAAGQGIVNGYGDGKFGPEDNVTYEQAVKMLVVALGFEPMAAQKGGFPTGYLVVANQYGMTEDVKVSGDSVAANRGVVAQLTFNALDMPMMTQTGFGTNVVYEVNDGKGDRDYQTLLVNFDVEKLDGVVVGTPVFNGTGLNADEFSYKINAVYQKKDSSFTKTTKTFKAAEGVNVNDFIGIASTVYVQELSNGKFEAIAVMQGETSEIIELERGDFDGTIGSDGILKYFESETATKSKSIKLDMDTTSADPAVEAVFNNDSKGTGATAVAAINGWNDATKITVINNDEDSAFDMVIGKLYTPDVVEEVEADRDRLTTKAAKSFKFDFEDEDEINIIVDKDGNEITLADFAEGDVIAYLQGANYNEIINLGQNVVTGTVTEKNTTDGTIAVDGVAYEVVGIIGSINVSDEGTFFLTADGKIFDKDTSASISSNYAYILEAGYGAAGAFNDAWQLRLLTKDGNITIFNMKDKFEIVGDQEYDETNTSSAEPAQFAAIKNNADHKTGNRLITYKLDSNNAIKEVTFIAGTAVADKEYKAAAQTIDRKVIADSAVIFNVSANDKDNAKVGTVESLVDETEYTGILAKVDANESEFNCFVITEGAAAIDYTQPLAIVDATSTSTDANGEDVTKVTYYTANDETLKSVNVVSGETSFVGGGAADLVKGTVFMLAEDANGVATDITIIAKYAATGYVIGSDAATAAIDAEEDNEFVAGYISTWRNNNGRVITYYGDRWADSAGTPAKDTCVFSDGGDDIVVTSKANAYTFVNNKASNNRGYIAVADWQADNDIDVAHKVLANGSIVSVEDGLATYFVARLVNGVVTDIVVLGDRAAK